MSVLNRGGSDDNALYRNNGGGSFSDEVNAAGVNISSINEAMAWADYDLDGDLDFFVARRAGGQSQELLQNDGDGTFTQADVASEITSDDGGYGAAWGDYDNDGDFDLYIATDARANFLEQNDGDGTFTERGAFAGVQAGVEIGFAPVWGDYDADGDLDLFVSSATGSTDRLFQNNGDGTFTDVSATLGLNFTGDSRGANWVDYDGDGDLDLYVSVNGASNFLYQSDLSPDTSTFFVVDVRGTGGSQDQGGITLSLFDGGTRIATRQNHGGGGCYGSQNVIPVHFYALNPSTSYTLRVPYPDNTTVDYALGTPDGSSVTVIQRGVGVL